MKKTLLVVILLAVSVIGHAQRVDSYSIPCNSLNLQVCDALPITTAVGIGVGLGWALGAGMAAALTGGQATVNAPEFKGWTPCFSVGYEHHFADTRWSLGPEAGYWHYGLQSDESYTHLHLMGIAAAGKFFYKPAGVCKLYGGVSLGAGAFISGGEVSPLPIFQINPIGMRLGGN